MTGIYYDSSGAALNLSYGEPVQTSSIIDSDKDDSLTIYILYGINLWFNNMSAPEMKVGSSGMVIKLMSTVPKLLPIWSMNYLYLFCVFMANNQNRSFTEITKAYDSLHLVHDYSYLVSICPWLNCLIAPEKGRVIKYLSIMAHRVSTL